MAQGRDAKLSRAATTARCGAAIRTFLLLTFAFSAATAVGFWRKRANAMIAFNEV